MRMRFSIIFFIVCLAGAGCDGGKGHVRNPLPDKVSDSVRAGNIAVNITEPLNDMQVVSGKIVTCSGEKHKCKADHRFIRRAMQRFIPGKSFTNYRVKVVRIAVIEKDSSTGNDNKEIIGYKLQLKDTAAGNASFPLQGEAYQVRSIHEYKAPVTCYYLVNNDSWVLYSYAGLQIKPAAREKQLLGQLMALRW